MIQRAVAAAEGEQQHRQPHRRTHTQAHSRLAGRQRTYSLQLGPTWEGHSAVQFHPARPHSQHPAGRAAKQNSSMSSWRPPALRAAHSSSMAGWRQLDSCVQRHAARCATSGARAAPPGQLARLLTWRAPTPHRGPRCLCQRRCQPCSRRTCSGTKGAVQGQRRWVVRLAAQGEAGGAAPKHTHTQAGVEQGCQAVEQSAKQAGRHQQP